VIGRSGAEFCKIIFDESHEREGAIIVPGSLNKKSFQALDLLENSCVFTYNWS
jgi:hypothetical protein